MCLEISTVDKPRRLLNHAVVFKVLQHALVVHVSASVSDGVRGTCMPWSELGNRRSFSSWALACIQLECGMSVVVAKGHEPIKRVSTMERQWRVNVL